MKIYNSDVLNHQQRFWLALAGGLVSSIVIGIVYYYINSFIHLEFEILYVAVGWLIGYVVQYLGHGVQTKYSIMAVVLTLVCFLISDFGIRVLVPSTAFFAIKLIIRSFFGSIWGLLSLLFRFAGCYTAYMNARFL